MTTMANPSHPELNLTTEIFIGCGDIICVLGCKYHLHELDIDKVAL